MMPSISDFLLFFLSFVCIWEFWFHPCSLTSTDTLLIGLLIIYLYSPMYFSYDSSSHPPIETGDMISKPLQGHSGVIESFANGTHIVSGSRDMAICLWDAEAGDVIFTLRGHSDSVRSVAFLPDGTGMSGSDDNNTIRV
jgi:WD40 repeat protein